jgi:RAB protein geranylgeranyltransferase component A
MKILQVDRNGYYGSDSASLNLTNLWKMFRDGDKAPEKYGENRDWNVDLIPKFVIANGKYNTLFYLINLTRKPRSITFKNWSRSIFRMANH